MSITITQLRTYPIKSCAGLSHDAAAFSHAGLQWDRHWVMVDGDGLFMTQRQYPRMALIQPSLTESRLEIRAPGMPDISVPLEAAPSQAIPVRIWKSDTLGQDEGDAAAAALSQFMGLPCRLLRTHRSAERLANPELVEAWSGRNTEWAAGFPQRHAFCFADGFPFLICNQASLDDLNRQVSASGVAPVGIERFRPNIVLDGLDAYDEDHLAGLQSDDMILAVVKHCTRCNLPNVDPATAQVGVEPGRALAAQRSFEAGILFGVNAVVSVEEGVLRVGDTFTPEYAI